jgi:hypothetical protein
MKSGVYEYFHMRRDSQEQHGAARRPSNFTVVERARRGCTALLQVLLQQWS